MFAGRWWDVVVKLWLRCTLVPRSKRGCVHWASGVILSVECDSCTGRWFKAISDLAAVSSPPRCVTDSTGLCRVSTSFRHTTAVWPATCESGVTYDDVGFVTCKAQLLTATPAAGPVAVALAESTVVLATDLELTGYQTQTQQTE